MEAVLFVSGISSTRRRGKRTLHELLTSVLLEKGLVDDRTGEVIDHKVDNRLNLVLSITGVVGNSGVLLTN